MGATEIAGLDERLGALRADGAGQDGLVMAGSSPMMLALFGEPGPWQALADLAVEDGAEACVCRWGAPHTEPLGETLWSVRVTRAFSCFSRL